MFLSLPFYSMKMSSVYWDTKTVWIVWENENFYTNKASWCNWKKVAEPDTWMMQISASDLEFIVWITLFFQIHLTIVILLDGGLDFCFVDYTPLLQENQFGWRLCFSGKESCRMQRLQTRGQVSLNVFCCQ